MKKKILLAAMCLVLSLGMSNSTQAANVVQNSETPIVNTTAAQARMSECGNCGKNGWYIYSTTYSSWVDTTETRTCSKYSTKKDIVQWRYEYITYKCSNCKYTQTLTSTGTRVYCNH
jgi:ssDNA-binding Zn-finger/Zn-ribbon topoisomerase 1